MTGFFCADCGARVPRDAQKCPICKAAFSSVKCPKCGFIGSPAKFADGCPQCGYSRKKKKAENTEEDRKKRVHLPSKYLLPAALTVMLLMLVLLIARISGVL